MDEALELLFARKQNAHTQSARKEQGKVAVFQAGHVMETIDCYRTAIIITIEAGMVKVEQCLICKMNGVVCYSQML